VVDERTAEPHLPRHADQAELGDVTDLDAVERALLGDVELGTAEEVQQLDAAARHRDDLVEASLRRQQRAHDGGLRQRDLIR